MPRLRFEGRRNEPVGASTLRFKLCRREQNKSIADERRRSSCPGSRPSEKNRKQTYGLGDLFIVVHIRVSCEDRKAHLDFYDDRWVNSSGMGNGYYVDG